MNRVNSYFFLLLLAFSGDFLFIHLFLALIYQFQILNFSTPFFTQLANLQKTLSDLQEERQRILDVLQQEREKSFSASERLEEHVELKVQQLATQRERELQEHFYEQTEALQKKVQSLHEALEIMRKNEDIADFDMTSDGITMPLLKTAFMQLQVLRSDLNFQSFL